MFTTMTAVAIDWPAMFSINSVPPFASVKGSPAVETIKETSSPQSVILQPNARRQVLATTEIARIKQAKAQALESRAVRAAIGGSRPSASSASMTFGPLTTKVGTVIFGNVTKQLYHRYWCTTRNW